MENVIGVVGVGAVDVLLFSAKVLLEMGKTVTIIDLSSDFSLQCIETSDERLRIKRAVSSLNSCKSDVVFVYSDYSWNDLFLDCNKVSLFVDFLYINTTRFSRFKDNLRVKYSVFVKVYSTANREVFYNQYKGLLYKGCDVVYIDCKENDLNLLIKIKQGEWVDTGWWSHRFIAGSVRFLSDMLENIPRSDIEQTISVSIFGKILK